MNTTEEGMVAVIQSKHPNPGSDEALDLGCSCPVLDNAHGRGIWTGNGLEPAFWISADCPLHGILKHE
jgi:hypothetical protein